MKNLSRQANLNPSQEYSLGPAFPDGCGYFDESAHLCNNERRVKPGTESENPGLHIEIHW
jgi:hypothetical protein